MGKVLHELTLPNSGKVNVFVQGDPASGQPVFLTVHDFGSNASGFETLLACEAMREVMNRSVWLHFEVPGQGQLAADLPGDYQFPTMDGLASDMLNVLEHFNVKLCVCVGEGAGGNVLARFAMSNPNMVIGLVAIHSTSTTAGVLENIKDRWMGRKLQSVGMTSTTEEYLIMYKYGRIIDAESAEEGSDADKRRLELIDGYRKQIEGTFNAHNLEKFMHSFMGRSDISSRLRANLKCDTLLIVGSVSSFLHTTETFYQHCDPMHSSLLKIDDVGNVVNEAPADVARGFVLFCKAFGLLATVKIPKTPGRNVTLTF